MMSKAINNGTEICPLWFQRKIIHPKRANTPKNATTVIMVSVFISRSIIRLIIPFESMLFEEDKAIEIYYIVIKLFNVSREEIH